jgi:hypothetical protein
MAGIEMQNVVLIALLVLVVAFVIRQYDPSFFGLLPRSMRAERFEDLSEEEKEGFEDAEKQQNQLENAHGNLKAGQMSSEKASGALNAGAKSVNAVKPGDSQSNGAAGNDLKKQPEGFADLGSYEGPAKFGDAEAPAGCYPRDQLTPAELLPKDMNSIWAEQNPMGPGSLKGKNFLSAGALIGVNTVGQSLRNANLQVRSEPPNPQVPVSIFLQSTIGPDVSHRTLEIN